VSRRHFKIYYKRWDANIGVGVEEYTPGRPSEVKMIASVFIKNNISDYELLCRLIDTYCASDGPRKIKTTQLVDRYTLDHLRTRYPDVTFRRITGKQYLGVKQLSHDALERRNTIYERFEGEDEKYEL